MVFNSFQYAVFLPGVLLVYWRLRHRGQNLLLLAASWLFYALFDWRFLGLMLLSTATDYTVGRVLAGTTDGRRRRAVFAVSLVVNLGILGFFKYWGFFATDVERVLHHLGLSPGLPVLRVALPIGISFYTFHGISYTFDVFRGTVPPTRNLLAFAVFVAYFPQLVAGPIGRAQRQLPQFEQPRQRPSGEQVASGLLLIALGLFKKIAVADAIAVYVNQAFASSATAGWPLLLVGMFGFALQIYGDFSGYSDIARGSSRLFGIELLINFEQPYLSRDITEFWHRWHISLSSWLRDYLYIPLGGNRRGERATYRNLLLTMVVGGLWHGAAWTFVLWGTVHGLLLAGHRGRHRARGRGDPDRTGRPLTPADAPAVAGTFVLVAAAFVLFRAPDLTVAGHLFGGILRLRPGGAPVDAVATLLYAAVALFGIDLAQRLGADHTVMLRWPAALQGAFVASILVPVVVFSGGAPVPFIYFRF
jgi:alginate O-acetyltransferase complex protein AlgI